MSTQQILDDLSTALEDSGLKAVEIDENGIIVKKFATDAELVSGPEFGTMRSAWTTYLLEEYNSKLRGEAGIRLYDRMRRSDASVRSSLRTIKTPITGGTWFVEPGDESPIQKEIAEFVWKNLTTYMTYSWRWVLREALNSLDFGYYMFEKVWAFGQFKGETRVFLKKLAPRHPIDVVEWKFDENGGPNAVVLYETEEIDQKSVTIPIEKLAVFTFEGEGGDLTGLSILRSAYKHWYFKETAYKIDAIQKERHGIGIPIVTLPMNASKDDKKAAKKLAQNLRVNEKAYAVLPFGWEVTFLKLEGEPLKVLETADHHSKMIFQNVLAQAMWGSNFGVTNTDATTSMDLFYKSIRQIAEEVIADIMNKYVIPQLVRFNWETDGLYPSLKVRQLGDVRESRELSFAIRNYVGAQVITPDDRLEEWARNTIDAPPAETSTARVVEAPQNPRQSAANRQRPMPKKNAGDDSSGG